MNENLDLTIILKGCPKGTEFHSSIYGKILFEGITCNSNDNFPIEFRECQGGHVFLPKSGKFDYENAECIVFPSKEQRDWSKFERFWDKPKEKFDPKTFKPFDMVLVRDGADECWKAMFFSHMQDYLQLHRAVCGGVSWKQCIPYNEETIYIVGTTKDCPEYYKWWEE